MRGQGSCLHEPCVLMIICSVAQYAYDKDAVMRVSTHHLFRIIRLRGDTQPGILTYGHEPRRRTGIPVQRALQILQE